MRHNTVLQHGPEGPFHYVSSGRDGAYPHEGCDYSCDHQSADEAYEHHRQWLLDNLRITIDPAAQQKCVECGAWTQQHVDGPAMNPPHLVVCEEHDVRAVAEALELPPGTKLDSWGS